MESWQIKLLSTVLNAAGVTILGIIKMLVILTISFITTTFLHSEKKKESVKNASKSKNKHVSVVPDYDEVGFC